MSKPKPAVERKRSSHEGSTELASIDLHIPPVEQAKALLDEHLAKRVPRPLPEASKEEWSEYQDWVSLKFRLQTQLDMAKSAGEVWHVDGEHRQTAPFVTIHEPKPRGGYRDETPKKTSDQRVETYLKLHAQLLALEPGSDKWKQVRNSCYTQLKGLRKLGQARAVLPELPKYDPRLKK